VVLGVGVRVGMVENVSEVPLSISQSAQLALVEAVGAPILAFQLPFT
jgi:hypothetical protein